jgi:D-alanine-D-alanine ligase-like ATP-grasp enzyme
VWVGGCASVLSDGLPTVTGDGRSTVEQLIFREYDRRIRGDGDPGIKAFAVDLDCLLTLDQRGLSLHSVPANGTTIRVKTVTNYNRPIDNDSVRDAASESLCAQAITAAHAAGLRLSGVDVVARTPCVDADGTSVVIDVNPVPALHHHLHVARPGTTSKVAVPILWALLHAPDR